MTYFLRPSLKKKKMSGYLIYHHSSHVWTPLHEKIAGLYRCNITLSTVPNAAHPIRLKWTTSQLMIGRVAHVCNLPSLLSLHFSSMQELNKLRLVALTYGMPELLEVLSSVLLKEEATASNPQIKTLLQTCVHFLSNNKNPQERLAITHKWHTT